MKKLIIPISMLFVAGLYHAQATNTENYIQTRVYLEPVTAPSSTAKQIQTVQYFDGLGRPKQIINVKASPLGKDVVTHIEYDGFGRQVKDFLPVPQSGTMNGTIVPNPLANASQPTHYGSEKIYTEKILENSPLDRVFEQKQVGNAWNDKPLKFEYDANSVADAVKKYTTVTTWINGATSSVLTQTANYGLAQLYKNTVIDEDGNKTIEFKNGEGQTVLVRKMLDGINSADTYYVYNEYNQLAYVIPPLAVAKNSVDSPTLNNLFYQYRYDGENRLVEKKLPGKGWEYMVYDKQDRLVLSQDAVLGTTANNFTKKGWMFTKYDQFGRVVYTGFFANTASRNSMQTAINNMNANSGNNETRSTTAFNLNGMDVYYTKNAFPTGSMTILGVNYYDTYPNGTPAIPTQILEQDVLSQDAQSSNISTKSLPVASYVKNIEDDNWTKNYTWYDKKGRAIGKHSINHLGGFTRIESKLDFTGVPQKTNTYHVRKQGESGITLRERFVYDNQNRLLQHYHQVDNKPEELLAENQYNEISQLINKKVGNNLQSIDYAYNIRGWMTGINKDQMNLPDLGGKLFSYKIKYNQRDGIENPDTAQFAGKNVTQKYNGNIAETDWRSIETLGVNPPLAPKRYGYAYDKLNRLTAGYYQNPDNPYSKENTESLAYDLNGNISALYRTSVVEYGNTSATMIDNLEYVYSGGDNKLTNINDYAYNDTGYEGGGNTIGYDINGNMTSMQDKGINLIKYNYLNLPNQLQMQASFENVTINTKYRADGIKLRKENTTVTSGFNGDTTQTNTTDYLDGFQYLQRVYQTSVVLEPELMTTRAMEPQAFSIDQTRMALPAKTPDLEFFPTAEGFYDYKKDQYIYQYKDQLGNARVSFGRNSSGSMEITDNNDYYPFGMNHLKTGNAFFGAGSYKNYKHQGQELQETGFYSFKWRDYIPDVGRFFNIDPLAEKFPYNSTYAFSENAVISYRELEGLEKVLAIFFTGGFRGEGKSTTEVNKHTQTPLALYNKVAEMGRANGVDVAGGVYQTTNEGLGRNAAANNASEFVQNNYQEGDKVVAFGFSHGGNQVVEFNDNLADMGIKTDASIIVDSSGGALGNSIVKTTVNNSEYVMNIFQPSANEGQSHGEKMKPGEGVGRMVNFNADVPNKPLEVEHSNILNKQQPLILNIFNKQVEAAATEKNKKGN